MVAAYPYRIWIAVNYELDAYEQTSASRPPSPWPQLRNGAAARKPVTSSYRRLLISVCYQFQSLRDRRGKRGPASTLLYDPERIDKPVAWLWERIGKVIVLPAAS